MMHVAFVAVIPLQIARVNVPLAMKAGLVMAGVMVPIWPMA
jgi:hypothetical protein